MSAAPADLVLGPWIPLPGGHGDALAISGALAAAASSTRAVVWDGLAVRADVVLEGEPAGIPRFVGDVLHYGTGWLEEGRWHALPPVAPTVHGPLRTSAWSRDGARLALLAGGPWRPGGAAPRALLAVRRRDGETSILAQEPGSERVWVLDERIVGVGRELEVWDATGLRLAVPAHAAGVATISATDDGAWLLTAGNDGTALLWDTATFAPPTAWPGPWRAAALAPDGRWAAAIAIDGTLHGGLRVGSSLAQAAPLGVGGVRSVVLDRTRLLASFEAPPFHRIADVTFAGGAA